MKKGRTLMELAQEVQDRAERKKDYVADTRQVSLDTRVVAPTVEDYKTEVKMQLNGIGEFDMDGHTHGQISNHLQIPKRYYDRMLQEAPHLLTNNVNHWLRENPTKRMVRTIDGRARAFLSNRYRVIDHEEVLEGILPTLMDMEMAIESCQVTESRLYVKAFFPQIEGEIKLKKVGEVVRAGVIISNSEVGLGSCYAYPMSLILSCLNGARHQAYGMKKYHVGRITGEGQDAIEFFKDDTRKADDQAFLLKLRDVVHSCADQAKFNTILEKMQDATEKEIEGDPVASVEAVQKKYQLTDDEQTSVLTHLIKGGDLTAFGMMNAVTRASQDVGDYDRATDLEKMGGEIIELPKTEWKEIATAKRAA
jgi:hypothetical protein